MMATAPPVTAKIRFAVPPLGDVVGCASASPHLGVRVLAAKVGIEMIAPRSGALVNRGVEKESRRAAITRTFRLCRLSILSAS